MEISQQYEKREIYEAYTSMLSIIKTGKHVIESQNSVFVNIKSEYDKINANVTAYNSIKNVTPTNPKKNCIISKHVHAPKHTVHSDITWDYDLAHVLFFLKSPEFYAQWLPCVKKTTIIDSSERTGSMQLELHSMGSCLDKMPVFMRMIASKTLNPRVVRLRWTIYDAVQYCNRIYIRFEDVDYEGGENNMKIGSFVFVFDKTDVNRKIGFLLISKKLNTTSYYSDVEGLGFADVSTHFIRNLVEYASKFEFLFGVDEIQAHLKFNTDTKLRDLTEKLIPSESFTW